MMFEKNLLKTSAILLSLERLWLFLICDTFIGKHWFKSFPKFPIISNVLHVKTIIIVLVCLYIKVSLLGLFFYDFFCSIFKEIIS